MGTKYSANSISGYNSSPPSDDGTVAEANKVKWSNHKTKLADPIKTLAEAIDTDLQTHFNTGPTAYTSNQTIDATHHNQVIQTSGAGITLTLSDAATLAAGWFTRIVNTDSTNTVTIARATAGDTINGTAANITLTQLSTVDIFVIAAATGFWAITYATSDNTQTETNKTLTAPVLSGSVTGTYTLAGTPTLTSPTINTPTITGATIDVTSGVAFPATQVPSGDANTLDDYEEGTWTPTLNFGGATTGITYSAQAGAYTKIGRNVFIDFGFTLSSKGSATGSATISGLPFSIVTAAAANVDLSYFSMTTSLISLRATGAGTSINLFKNTVATTDNVSSAIQETDFSGTTSVWGTFSYRV